MNYLHRKLGFCSQFNARVFALGFVLVAALSPYAAHAATLSFTNAAGTVGQTVSVSVLVSSEGSESLNGVSAHVTYPSDKLSLLSLSKAGSIITFWAAEPSFSNAAGSASAEGIIPSPGYTGQGGRVITLVFQVKAPGAATLSFDKSSVLANDGQGTDILTGAYSRTLTLSGASATPAPAPAPTPKPKPETTGARPTTRPASSGTNAVGGEEATTSSSTVPATIEPAIQTVSIPVSPRLPALWNILIFLLALLGLAALGIVGYYGWPVLKEALIARQVSRRGLVQRSFALLRTDIEEHMTQLRASEDPLSRKEVDFLAGFEKDLGEVEKLVERRLHSKQG